MKTGGPTRSSPRPPPPEDGAPPPSSASSKGEVPAGDVGANLRALGRDVPRTARAAPAGLPQLKAASPQASKLGPDAKALLRRARDENIDALMARFALNLVNGPDGYFGRLNPRGVAVTRRGQPARSVEQRYEVIDAVCDLLRVGVGADRIGELVDGAAAEAGDEPAVRAGQALERFFAEARQEVQTRVHFVSALTGPSGAVGADLERIGGRLARVRWVHAQLNEARRPEPGAARPPEAARARSVGPAGSFEAELTALLDRSTLEAALEALDARFESVMDAALDAAVASGGLRHLDTVAYQRLPASPRVRAPAEARAEALPDDHPHYHRLNELAARLARGEQSAIGGADYARQRLPREVLDDVVAGTTHAVVYNGARARALDYVRDRYGPTRHGERAGARVMGLQGLDGSGTRLLVTLDGGARVLLMAGLGEARQLHNAGAVLLYEDPEGRRVDVGRLDLATDGADLVGRMRADLERALGADWAKARGRRVLGRRLQDPRAMPTQLVVVQNPSHLAEAFGDRFAWGARPQDTLFEFFIAYAETGAGLTRLVVPKVGGHGLYGDTAGDFVRAFFSAEIGPTNPNVLFNGTAGGFAGTAEALVAQELRGLGDVSPGGLIMPTVALESFGDEAGPMTMVTFMGPDLAAWPDVLRGFEARGAVSVTDRHVAVPAPALETYEMIDELVARGHASVDVEGGAVLRAVHDLRADRPDVTFTPIYTHSDDPRASRHDPFDSLAMMGPLFEGSTFDPDLYDLVFTLIGLTQPKVPSSAHPAREGPR